MTIAIRHTHEDGTLIEGSRKGDGVYDVVRHLGFRYFPSIQAIGIRGSRDHVAKRWQINAAADALRAAGFEVAVEIDDSPRDRAEVLADQAERLDERAEALTTKVACLHASADGHLKAADEIAYHRNGQPILVGHHSERRSRADQRRIERHMGKFCEEYGEAKETDRRAAAVGSNAAYSERPGVTARRIKTAEAELRKIQRNLDGRERTFRDHAGNPYYIEKHEPAAGEWRESLLARRVQLENQVAYDRQRLEAAKAEGSYVEYGRHNVHVGDLVRAGFSGWRKVVKVNRTTVSVETGYTWTDKVPFTDIRENRPGGAS